MLAGAGSENVKATSTKEGVTTPVPSIFLIFTVAATSNVWVGSFICHFLAVSPVVSTISLTSTRKDFVLLGPPVASSVTSYGE